MTTRSSVTGLAGAALGLAALVLPFYAGISPLDVFLYGWLMDPWQARLSVATSLLAIPIAAWQLRRLRPSPPGPIWIALSYSLATSAMLAFFIAISWEMIAADAHYLVRGYVAIAVSCILACCNVALLIHNLRAGTAAHTIAELFLLGGYLPAAVCFLVAWLNDFGSWGLGGYAVLLTCVVFVVHGVLLFREGPSAMRGG